MEGKTIGRIAALDGLRGVAILLVVAYHYAPNLMPGGAYGVTLFFVLSGFLITRILEKSRDWRTFYWNRAIRLIPALIPILVFAWVASGKLNLHPLIYTSNWAILSGVDMPGLWHTWSLAVEEHFYLAWPAVVWLTPSRYRKPVTASLFVVAVAWYLHMVSLGGSGDRIQFGTDTAAFALLAGCVLAVWKIKVSGGPGLVAMAGIVGAALFIDAKSWDYLWGQLVVVLLAGIAVAAAHHARMRPLEVRWLGWFGVVSYGLYLWHEPLRLLVPDVLALTLGVLTAALSWHLFEQPIIRRFKSSGPRVESGRQAVVVVPNEPAHLIGTARHESGAAY